MHDFVTIWYLLNPDAVRLSKVPIKVIPDQGEGFGQSIADFRFVTNPVIKHIISLFSSIMKDLRDIMETF